MHFVPHSYGKEWMTVAVHIRNNATLEVRVVEDGILRPDNTFIWEDGNFSCDCNRRLFFERAQGREPEDADVVCGDQAYAVRVVNPATGAVLYDEFSDG